MNAVTVWCDDVYTSQVYFLTTHYCYQSIEFNDMLSRIRRLNTLLFNVRKNLPSVLTENNSASVIGHAGCRRHICDMIGWGGLFHLQPLLRGWPPAARWQAAASSCCCSSLAMLPSSRWWRLAFDRRSGKWFIVCSPKNYVTQVRSSYAGKSQKLAKIVEPRVTNTSKIIQHTVPKLVNFRQTTVEYLELYPPGV